MATNNPDLIKSSYLSQFLRTPHLKQTITKSVKKLRKVKFDSVAFQGMSGALLGPSIAMKLDKNLLMVRKGATPAHSKMPVEGFFRSKTYVIVDDFIVSGLTVAQIYYSIRKFAPTAKCVGVLCGSDDYSGTRPEFILFESVRKRYARGFKNYRERVKNEKAREECLKNVKVVSSIPPKAKLKKQKTR